MFGSLMPRVKYPLVKTETKARPVMGLTNARKQMTRFSTFILAVVMISGGVSFAFAQQAQPRYVVSPFAPFFNFGNRSSGPIPHRGRFSKQLRARNPFHRHNRTAALSRDRPKQSYSLRHRRWSRWDQVGSRS